MSKQNIASLTGEYFKILGIPEGGSYSEESLASQFLDTTRNINRKVTIDSGLKTYTKKDYFSSGSKQYFTALTLEQEGFNAKYLVNQHYDLTNRTLNTYYDADYQYLDANLPFGKSLLHLSMAFRYSQRGFETYLARVQNAQINKPQRCYNMYYAYKEPDGKIGLGDEQSPQNNIFPLLSKSLEHALSNATLADTDTIAELYLRQKADYHVDNCSFLNNEMLQYLPNK